MCSNCKPSKNECSCEKKHGCCKRKCCEPKPKNCCCEPVIYTAPVYDSRGVSGSFGGIGNSLTQSYGIIPGPVGRNVNNTLGN